MGKSLLFALMLVAVSFAWGAEEYPSKPVRVVVPYAPGGNTDIAARALSQQLSEQLGRTFLVDNHPGATGTVGSAVVARSPADGYTLAMADSSWSIVPGLYKSLPYDVVADFTQVSQVMRVPNVLVVSLALDVTTLRDFIARLKANPGKFNFASSGAGSINHLMPELFKKAAGVNLVHVPYKGAGDTITALIGNEVQMLITPLPPVLPHIKSGRMRALAVTTDARLPSLPDVPTMNEAGVQGMVIYYWAGLVGPAKMPAAIVSKLHAETVKALGVQSVKDQFVPMSAELVGGTPDEFTRFIRTEVQRWAEVVRSAGITPE
jgi:tripartite-type tricarboxylate transporter receptor subunit TctC